MHGRGKPQNLEVFFNRRPVNKRLGMLLFCCDNMASIYMSVSEKASYQAIEVSDCRLSYITSVRDPFAEAPPSLRACMRELRRLVHLASADVRARGEVRQKAGIIVLMTTNRPSLLLSGKQTMPVQLNVIIVMARSATLDFRLVIGGR